MVRDYLRIYETLVDAAAEVNGARFRSGDDPLLEAVA
jgi:hypothetical protein